MKFNNCIQKSFSIKLKHFSMKTIFTLIVLAAIATNALAVYSQVMSHPETRFLASNTDSANWTVPTSFPAGMSLIQPICDKVTPK